MCTHSPWRRAKQKDGEWLRQPVPRFQPWPLLSRAVTLSSYLPSRALVYPEGKQGLVLCISRVSVGQGLDVSSCLAYSRFFNQEDRL